MIGTVDTKMEMTNYVALHRTPIDYEVAFNAETGDERSRIE